MQQNPFAPYTQGFCWWVSCIFRCYPCSPMCKYFAASTFLMNFFPAKRHIEFLRCGICTQVGNNFSQLLLVEYLREKIVTPRTKVHSSMDWNLCVIFQKTSTEDLHCPYRNHSDVLSPYSHTFWYSQLGSSTFLGVDYNLMSPLPIISMLSVLKKQTATNKLAIIFLSWCH